MEKTQQADLSAYEAERLRTIARNEAMLSTLGLHVRLIDKKNPLSLQHKKRPRQPPKPKPTRELSRRTRSIPVPVYTPGFDEVLAEDARKDDIEEGRRLPDGTWLGERFGDVRGVPVGTVFGAGDYQRLGRQQMTESGFFRPFVTPEWVAPGEGCYSVILNNDNGASSDEGDRIIYAGSGGRRRGQNRTAPQSFDQDWTNVTNAALRLNCETGKPVRVVRGPKLNGPHGTSADGGGYRYDGLFVVERAELERLPGSRYRTAMFTMVRMP
jgi:E3 ubiquitin-protein ligase UHRF1